MKVISVANYKGGCSKTTTAVSLGACLAELDNGRIFEFMGYSYSYS